AVSQVELHAPEIPYISNLTGGWIRDEEATDPAYWVQHVRQAVRFSQGLETMLEALADPKAILLEVGPGRSLSTLARQHPQVGTGELLLSSLRHPQDKQSDVAFLLTSLGRLWLAGVDIDWQGFSEHERRHRLPLPTYPFERRRFWIEPPTDSKGALFNGTYGNGIHSNDTHADRELINGMPERMVLPPRKPDVADWFYVPTWKSTMVSPQEEAQTLLDGTTLFFLDEYGLGEAVAQQLQYQGRGIITVQIGTHFAKLDTQAYMLNPREPGNYIALFDELRRLDDLPDQIVHLWTVTSDQPSDAPLVWAEEMQYRGFYSLLYLSQALGRQNLAATCSLTVVSTNMQEVAGESLLHPEKATILGAVRVIPQEYPTIRCRTVDIILPSQGCIQPGCTGLSGRDFQDNIQVAIQDSSQDNSQDNKRRYREKRLIEQLLSELKTEPFDFTNAVIAYRGNHRWQQTYTPVQLTQPSQGYKNSQEAGQLHSAPFQNRGLVSQVADKENACFGNDRRIDSHLRTGGVYLITGGLGGIGLTLAAHLARHCQPKLILVGRSPLPDRREWNKWLGNHDAEENISRTLREVQKLEELGAEVLLLSGDVANLEQMESIIEQAQEHFGPINGVIHAAGVAGGGIIQHKTHGEAERILAPKVRGTLVLNSVLKDIDLDFWVLCSSTAAIQGIIGQVDYAAANAFLDAFAHYKTAQDGLFTVSINWDTWREVGMAVGTMGDTGVNGGANTGGLSELQKWRSEALQQGIVPAEGADSFERILNGTQPQVVVSPRDFLKLLEYATTFNANAIIDRVEQSQSSALAHPSLAHPRPAMGNPYVAPRNETEETLVTLWQELLGIEQIGIYDNFFELGGHSLLASQLTSRINEKLQTDLSMSILFEEPTVDCLTKYIRKLYQTVKQLQIPSRTLHQEREEITL
ncbi:MAG: SDR family NAD(P)-dependent oxidoreductase, partial [Chloroflexota bacterium]